MVTSPKLIGLLSRFNPVKVAVIGDFMLDTYTVGKVRRISPEAPVSVLHVQKEESRAGGAGNVVLNLLSLGAHVCAVGRIGADQAGHVLRQSLMESGSDVSGIAIQERYHTPIKNRLIADSQQVLRVDFENASPIPFDLENQILEELPANISDVQIIAVSDYAKGFLSRRLLSGIIELAHQKGIRVIIDPKGDDFSKYAGADIIKPNLSEAYAAAKLPADAPLDLVAEKILEHGEFAHLIITRSEAGISLFSRNGGRIGERHDFPVRSREVKDVTGAGDTVLATLSAALANGLDLKLALQLSNVAAGIAIERIGCVRVTLADLASRLLEADAEHKVFDEEHLFALQQVLQGKRYCVLGIENTHGISSALFRAIRTITNKDPERQFIVYIRDQEHDPEFISLLASLSEIDFIVLQSESLRNLCDVIHPHEVFLMQNDRLVSLDHASALLDTVG
jgi:D-beta-D-heptose 7-phosphate kinase/D-beta-D-heptose 1-phosphate adenosyltransferase